MNAQHTIAAHEAPAATPMDADTVRTLVRNLTNDNPRVRRRSRQQLVSMGELAVGPLQEALESRHPRLRCEAARVLGQIRDATVAAALVRRLEDDYLDVRWLAGQGLVALGRDGLVALLRAMMEEPASVRRREGAHHVLRILAQRGQADVVGPVLAAIEGVQPGLTVPLAAHAALHKLQARVDRDHNPNRE